MNNSLCIEKILPLEELERLVPEYARLSIATQASSRRRAESLMWRAVVCRYLPDARIDYNAIGAPVVTNYPVHIGVSHCLDYVAVCLSERPCAVDIEPLARDFNRASARFATDDERRLSDGPLLLPALWCGKEALYKYAGRRELDLLRDLKIESLDLQAWRMIGRIGDDTPMEIGIRVEQGLFVAFIFR